MTYIYFDIMLWIIYKFNFNAYLYFFNDFLLFLFFCNKFCIFAHLYIWLNDLHNSHNSGIFYELFMIEFNIEHHVTSLNFALILSFIILLIFMMSLEMIDQNNFAIQVVFNTYEFLKQNENVWKCLIFFI